MSFALATSAASAVGAKRAPVAGARLGKSAHIPRRAMQSSVTRAAVGADEGAAIKPFEVRTPRRIPRALEIRRHAAPPPAPIAGASNGDAVVPGGARHRKPPIQIALSARAKYLVWTGMTGVVVFGSDGFFEKRRGVVFRALRTRAPGRFVFVPPSSFTKNALTTRRSRVRTRTDLPPTSLRTSSLRSSRRRQSRPSSRPSPRTPSPITAAIPSRGRRTSTPSASARSTSRSTSSTTFRTSTTPCTRTSRATTCTFPVSRSTS